MLTELSLGMLCLAAVAEAWHREKPFIFSVEIRSHDLLWSFVAPDAGIPGVLWDFLFFCKFEMESGKNVS